MSVQAATADSLLTSTILPPYSKFKMALKSKEVSISIDSSISVSSKVLM
jgi:hypothetical protein